MTRDEIIALAQKCQLIGANPHEDGIYLNSLKAFAALIENALREGSKCPSCEYNKLRAQNWRHAAYKASGAPLPWEPDGSAIETTRV